MAPALLLLLLATTPAESGSCAVKGLGAVTLAPGLSCAAFTRNVQTARATILARGFATRAQVQKAWGGLRVRAVADKTLLCVGQVTRGCYEPTTGVTVTRDCGALLHELLHAVEWTVSGRVSGNGYAGHAGWEKRGWHEAAWDYDDAAEAL